MRARRRGSGRLAAASAAAVVSIAALALLLLEEPEHPGLRLDALEIPGGGVRRVALPDPIVLERDVLGPIAVEPGPPSPEPPPPPEDVPVDLAWLDRLLMALRDDDVKGNAGVAVERLERALSHVYPSLPAEVVEAALVEGLHSADLQQRHLCAVLVLDRNLAAPGWLRAEAALDFLSDGRRSGDPRALDEARSALGAWTGPRNLAVKHLIEHDDLADVELQRLAAGTGSDVETFLSAYILAMRGRVDLTDRLAPVLIERLADNRIPQDAEMALGALSRLDGRVRALLDASPSTDAQHERLRDELLDYLASGPRRREHLERHERSMSSYRRRFQSHRFVFYDDPWF